MEIEAAYAESHLEYHTLAHIEAVLSSLDVHCTAFDDPEMAELAFVYHDLVYDPVRHDTKVKARPA